MVPGDTLHALQRTITLVTRGGKVFRKPVRLDAKIFNQVIRHLKADFEFLIEKSLESIGLEVRDVSQVVLVGGGAHLFTVIHHLRDRFGADRVLLADNPEEIVVRGVALELGESEQLKQMIGVPMAGLRRPQGAGKPDSEMPDGDVEEATPSVEKAADGPQAINDQDTDEDVESIAAHAVVADAEVSSEQLVDAPVSDLPVIHWRLEEASGVIHEITGERTKLGRRKTNDIPLKDDLASRFHAELHLVGGTLSIEDQGSLNGTYVNETRLEPHKARELLAGDRIRICGTEFECKTQTTAEDGGIADE